MHGEKTPRSLWLIFTELRPKSDLKAPGFWPTVSPYLEKYDTFFENLKSVQNSLKTLFMVKKHQNGLNGCSLEHVEVRCDIPSRPTMSKDVQT